MMATLPENFGLRIDGPPPTAVAALLRALLHHAAWWRKLSMRLDEPAVMELIHVAIARMSEAEREALLTAVAKRYPLPHVRVHRWCRLALGLPLEVPR